MKQNIFQLVIRNLIFLTAISLALQVKAEGKTSTYNSKDSAKNSQIHIASYNLQNLFDTQHDKGKNDWEFLPRDAEGKSEGCDQEKSSYGKKRCLDMNWTDEKLNIKYEKIKEVVSAINPELPDILTVQEVENKNVLLGLAQKLGYKSSNVILEEGPDKRGIDVGLLYKEDNLKYIVTKTVGIKSHSDYPTREVLITYFGILLSGEQEFFFPYHGCI